MREWPTWPFSKYFRTPCFAGPEHVLKVSTRITRRRGMSLRRAACPAWCHGGGSAARSLSASCCCGARAIAQDEAVQRRLAACGSGSPDCQGRDPRTALPGTGDPKPSRGGGRGSAASGCSLVLPSLRPGSHRSAHSTGDHRGLGPPPGPRTPGPRGSLWRPSAFRPRQDELSRP